MEEEQDSISSPSGEPATTATAVASTKFEGVVNPESMSVLKKAFFLAVVIGGIAVYLRLSKAKQRNSPDRKSVV